MSINILDFKYTNDYRFYKSYHVREDRTNEIFTDILEWHIIELPKLPAENTGDSMYNWLKFIKAENKEELEMMARTDTNINEAYKQLEIMSQDRDMKIAYTSRLKAIMDYNTVMEERYEMGRQERDLQLINSWRKKGMTEEEIEQLLN